MRHTRDMTVLTVEDCIESLPPELLEADNETIRSEIPNYFLSGYHDTVREADYVVFCTPDQRYIGIKYREAPESSLDRRNEP